jgi:phosphate-selective porin OprO/OprP
MNGVIDGGSADANSNDAFDVIGRIFVHPFQETSIEPLQGLGIGFAGSFGRQNTAKNTATSTPTAQYRTVGQQIFFSYGVGVEQIDEQVRLAPQAYWYWGPFGAMFEWVRSSPRLRLGGSEISPDIDSWQITAGYVLTGEARTYQGVVPRSSFNPAREDTGAGAWELVARVDELSIDKDVFDKGFANPATTAQEAFEWGVGLNWYINPFLKLSVDYNDTRFNRGAPDGRNRGTEGVLGTRLQVAF